MKVILAIDGSPHSEAALAEVGRRPWPNGTVIEILTVPYSAVPLAIDPAFVLAAVHVEQIEEQRRRATMLVDDARERLRRAVPNVEVVTKVLEGNPKDVIVQEARDIGADLIVVGSHGHGRFRRLVLGSVAGAVVANAPCSVHVVRDKDAFADSDAA
jgi:nucleotide-binding universal stress UspA family protein